MPLSVLPQYLSFFPESLLVGALELPLPLPHPEKELLVPPTLLLLPLLPQFHPALAFQKPPLPSLSKGGTCTHREANKS